LLGTLGVHESLARPYALPLLGAPSTATESTKAQCLQAYSDAQRLRKDGKLIASRAELVRCAQDDCPQVTKADCVPWLREVESATPTLVVLAKDRQGRDTADVKVSIDGAVVAERLDGRSIAVDPGAHLLRFEHGEAPAIEQQLVVQESVKDRQVEVSFAVAGAAAPSSAPSTAPQPGTDPPSADAGSSSGLTAAGGVLIGLGVVGLGLFATLGLIGQGEVDGYQESCAPTKSCSEDDVESTRSMLVAADVMLGIGLTALTVGLVLVIYDATSGEESPAPPAAAVRVQPVSGGAVALGTLRF
jgi:hypothetical protein